MSDRPVATEPTRAGCVARVTFYVQHLLGIGHLVRASRIAKAMAEAGFDVELLVGGVLPPNLDAGAAAIVQLPPVRIGEDGFSALVHADGTAFDAAAHDRRRDLLLGHFDRHRPDILMIEAFPFGRRQMRFELMPLIERARARRDAPLIVSSVRDILQDDRRPDRVAETLDLIDGFFDLVLVHGDPALVSLPASFPAARRFVDKIAYTGLVAPPAAARKDDRFGAVISVGGGAVGSALLNAAFAAKPLTPLADRPWLFLAGPNLPREDRMAVERNLDPGSILTVFAPDLAALLGEATLSISQAGYNTVADILSAGCRSVLIPYAAEGETEQTRRATLLEQRDRAVMVEETGLTPIALAHAVARALDQSWNDEGLDLLGAKNSARVLLNALAKRTDC